MLRIILLTSFFLISNISYSVANDVFEQMKIRAETGDIYAQADLGVMYEKGVVVGKDNREALKWYKRAAERGSSAGQYNLGLAYEYGKGVRSDDREAIKWYKLAGEQGHVSGMYNVGVLYYVERAGMRDYSKAAKWFKLAAKYKHAKALYFLGILYGNGEGVRQNLYQAKEYYGQACDAGEQIGSEWFRKLNQGGY